MTKRTFDVIRKKLVLGLVNGQLTVNNLSKKAGVNWKTVDNHIIHLIGKGYVKEVFSSPYVRIIELTEKGKEHAAKLGDIK